MTSCSLGVTGSITWKGNIYEFSSLCDQFSTVTGFPPSEGPRSIINGNDDDQKAKYQCAYQHTDEYLTNLQIKQRKTNQVSSQSLQLCQITHCLAESRKETDGVLTLIMNGAFPSKRKTSINFEHDIQQDSDEIKRQRALDTTAYFSPQCSDEDHSRLPSSVPPMHPHNLTFSASPSCTRRRRSARNIATAAAAAAATAATVASTTPASPQEIPAAQRLYFRPARKRRPPSSSSQKKPNNTTVQRHVRHLIPPSAVTTRSSALLSSLAPVVETADDDSWSMGLNQDPAHETAETDAAAPHEAAGNVDQFGNPSSVQLPPSADQLPPSSVQLPSASDVHHSVDSKPAQVHVSLTHHDILSSLNTNNAVESSLDNIVNQLIVSRLENMLSSSIVDQITLRAAYATIAHPYSPTLLSHIQQIIREELLTAWCGNSQNNDQNHDENHPLEPGHRSISDDDNSTDHYSGSDDDNRSFSDNYDTNNNNDDDDANDDDDRSSDHSDDQSNFSDDQSNYYSDDQISHDSDNNFSSHNTTVTDDESMHDNNNHDDKNQIFEKNDSGSLFHDPVQLPNLYIPDISSSPIHNDPSHETLTPLPSTSFGDQQRSYFTAVAEPIALQQQQQQQPQQQQQYDLDYDEDMPHLATPPTTQQISSVLARSLSQGSFADQDSPIHGSTTHTPVDNNRTLFSPHLNQHSPGQHHPNGERHVAFVPAHYYREEEHKEYDLQFDHALPQMLKEKQLNENHGNRDEFHNIITQQDQYVSFSSNTLDYDLKFLDALAPQSKSTLDLIKPFTGTLIHIDSQNIVHSIHQPSLPSCSFAFSLILHTIEPLTIPSYFGKQPTQLIAFIPNMTLEPSQGVKSSSQEPQQPVPSTSNLSGEEQTQANTPNQSASFVAPSASTSPIPYGTSPILRAVKTFSQQPYDIAECCSPPQAPAAPTPSTRADNFTLNSHANSNAMLASCTLLQTSTSSLHPQLSSSYTYRAFNAARDAFRRLDGSSLGGNDPISSFSSQIITSFLRQTHHDVSASPNMTVFDFAPAQFGVTIAIPLQDINAVRSFQQQQQQQQQPHFVSLNPNLPPFLHLPFKLTHNDLLAMHRHERPLNWINSYINVDVSKCARDSSFVTIRSHAISWMFQYVSSHKLRSHTWFSAITYFDWFTQLHICESNDLFVAAIIALNYVQSMHCADYSPQLFPIDINSSTYDQIIDAVYPALQTVISDKSAFFRSSMRKTSLQESFYSLFQSHSPTESIITPDLFVQVYNHSFQVPLHTSLHAIFILHKVMFSPYLLARHSPSLLALGSTLLSILIYNLEHSYDLMSSSQCINYPYHFADVLECTTHIWYFISQLSPGSHIDDVFSTTTFCRVSMLPIPIHPLFYRDVINALISIYTHAKYTTSTTKALTTSTQSSMLQPPPVPDSIPHFLSSHRPLISIAFAIRIHNQLIGLLYRVFSELQNTQHRKLDMLPNFTIFVNLAQQLRPAHSIASLLTSFYSSSMSFAAAQDLVTNIDRITYDLISAFPTSSLRMAPPSLHSLYQAFLQSNPSTMGRYAADNLILFRDFQFVDGGDKTIENDSHHLYNQWGQIYPTTLPWRLTHHIDLTHSLYNLAVIRTFEQYASPSCSSLWQHITGEASHGTLYCLRHSPHADPSSFPASHSRSLSSSSLLSSSPTTFAAAAQNPAHNQIDSYASLEGLTDIHLNSSSHLTPSASSAKRQRSIGSCPSHSAASVLISPSSLHPSSASSCSFSDGSASCLSPNRTRTSFDTNEITFQSTNPLGDQSPSIAASRLPPHISHFGSPASSSSSGHFHSRHLLRPNTAVSPPPARSLELPRPVTKNLFQPESINTFCSHFSSPLHALIQPLHQMQFQLVCQQIQHDPDTFNTAPRSNILGHTNDHQAMFNCSTTTTSTTTTTTTTTTSPSPASITPSPFILSSNFSFSQPLSTQSNDKTSHVSILTDTTTTGPSSQFSLIHQHWQDIQDFILSYPPSFQHFWSVLSTQRFEQTCYSFISHQQAASFIFHLYSHRHSRAHFERIDTELKFLQQQWTQRTLPQLRCELAHDLTWD